MTMKPPAEKQTAYRAGLLRRCLENARTPGSGCDPDTWELRLTGQRIAGLGFALALPEPRTADECSEQIASLESGDGFAYAERHRDWGMTVLARLALIYGDDPAGHPETLTVAELRSAATGILR